MKRSTSLAALAFTAALSLTALPSKAADPDTFKIGAIASFSGAYGIVGNDMKRGVELAIEQRGGRVLGKPISVTWEDDETKAQVAVQKGARLIGDGAHMLFGAIASGSTLALQGLSDQRKVPLLVTVSADDKLTRRNGSRYTFRTSNNMDMEIRMASQYTRDVTLKRIYAVVVDVGVARDSWDNYAKSIADHGVKVVAVDYTPIGTRDYSVLIDKIAKTDADGVMVFLFANDAVTFLKQAAQVNLGKGRTQFGPVLIDDALAAAVGPSSVGVMSAVRYHYSFDVPANRKFVDAYRAKYGDWPTAVAGEAYDGMSWWLDVVDSTKVWDAEKWIAAFERSTRDNSIEGRKVMRSCDHQAAQHGLWGMVSQGAKPMPPLTMQIQKTYPIERLYDPC